jgi:hypothetical protein
MHNTNQAYAPPAYDDALRDGNYPNAPKGGDISPEMTGNGFVITEKKSRKCDHKNPVISYDS